MIDTDSILTICEECDTVWMDGKPSGKPPFVILDEYMERFEKTPLWSHLERLERGSKN
ncbi:hypothetical protein ABZ615_27665 [Streptomyces sp. NPDC007325]|uniref:hypothetical protein n=1 Tax=Streptomyces sp. NPDC007325 TaxID=3154588 RepID=UPI0033F8DD8D